MAGNNLGTAVGTIKINTSNLKNADLALRSAGAGLLNIGEAAVGAFGAIVGTGAKFEKEISTISAVTGTTGKDLDLLREKAISLGTKGIFGPIELANSFVELAKAGVSTQDIIDGVGEASVNLASAAGIGLTNAAEIIVSTGAIFGLGAKDAAKSADIIAGAANASLIDVNDFATSLKYAGPIAASLGIKVDDLATTISLLGQSGIKGSTAGTSLRRIMLQLTPQTKKAKEAMKALSLITADGSNQFYDAAGNAKTLTEVFGIFGNSIKGLTKEQKVQAATTIFGARAVTAALFLAEQGTDKFNEFQKEIADTSAQDVAAKRTDNLDGAIKRLKATLQAIFITGSGPLQKGLQSIVDGITGFLKLIQKLPAPLQTALLVGLGLAGVLAILAGGFLLTIGNMVRAIRVIGEIRNAFSLLGAGARVAAAGEAAAGGGALAAIGPFLLVIAVVAAIAAAFYFAYTRIASFREFINFLWQEIQKGWDKVLAIFRAAPKFFEDVFGKVEAFFKRIPGYVSSAAGAIGRFFSSVGDAVTGAVDAVGRFFGRIGDQIGNAAGAVGRFFTDLPSRVGNAISTAASAVSTAIGKATGAVARFMTALPGRIGYALGYALGFFIRWTVTIIKNLIIWGAKLIKLIFNIVVEFVKTFVTEIFRLPGQIIRLLANIIALLFDAIPTILQASISIGGSIFSGIWDFIKDLPGQIWGVLTSIGSFLGNAAVTLASTAASIGSSIFHGIVDLITGLPGLIIDILGKVISAFKDLVVGAFNAAKNFASGLWEGFKDGLGIHSPSHIEVAMDNIHKKIRKKVSALGQQVRRVQALTTRVPTIRQPNNPNADKQRSEFPGSVDWSKARKRTTPYTSNDLPPINNYHAPLIGVAHIRSDQDIVDLSRQLAREQARQQRARGR
jgi:phage tail tape measure protein, TP901 family, core region